MGLTFLLVVALVIPLFSFISLLVLGEKRKIIADKLASAGMGVSAMIFIWFFVRLFYQGAAIVNEQFSWLSIGNTKIEIGLWADHLSIGMLVVVSVISFLVHLFSMVYMHADPKYVRYFAYLNLFTFSMFGLVLSPSLIQMYIFWEMVGVSSYLLIGFWHFKDSAAKAAKKAFIVNRIGDAGFLVAILVALGMYGTTNIQELQELIVLDSSIVLLQVLGVGLVLAAMAKSAQWPLSVWLPDAMEGPTPVSALIHAATMVAAGIFLLARNYFAMTPEVQLLMVVSGGITMVLAAITALFQFDIKRVLAFSTLSQLGYMMVALGVGGVFPAVFHLFSHAFFKAGLFLGSGLVIHYLHEMGEKHDIHFDAQDIRFMGGLHKKLPVLAWGTFLVSALALAGLPLTSGFLSKDAILAQTVSFAESSSSQLAWLVPVAGFATALLTAIYVARLIGYTFFGENRFPKEIRETEKEKYFVPKRMLFPLTVLAVLSFFFAFSLNPLHLYGGWIEGIKLGQLSVSDDLVLMTEILSAVLGVSGLLFGYWFFTIKKAMKPMADDGRLTFDAPNLGAFSYWISWDVLASKAGEKIALAFSWFDQNVVDGIVRGFSVVMVVFSRMVFHFDSLFVDGMVNGIAKFFKGFGKQVQRSFNGDVQYYYFLIVLGFAALLIGFTF
ncbi:NADH-quinone oxidoreductase subunit 5 family protein [Sediminitomix flava]|uniref:NADH-quinone oxidoreductase subunit L n=1 Tax=Sediminitomix flava TaxID=379075 RepID=A0A315Z7M5_SEDFL|nr:NADH-quinone oxidoreductase subunit L [Sediminitomix flava]PWJ40041.1 NADH-quinone oxidoreductase subunit L [Sediminitomix flava]